MRQIFRDFGMSVTVWTSGVAAEQSPDIVAALADDGHEIGAHGYSQGRVMASMSRPAQEEAIRKSAELLERVCGQ
jgi:peptidoglycan/xylan/chitin deacetylase (PgdA/CDA1 family)